MNWRLLAPLAVIGPLMGTLMVAGAFPPDTDRFAWFAIVLCTAFVISRREPVHPLKHGFAIGLWNGATATLIQALMVGRVLANNPWMVEKFAKQPPGFDMQFFMFMLVPFIGVAGGAATGFFAIVFVRVLKSR